MQEGTKASWIRIWIMPLCFIRIAKKVKKIHKKLFFSFYLLLLTLEPFIFLREVILRFMTSPSDAFPTSFPQDEILIFFHFFFSFFFYVGISVQLRVARPFVFTFCWAFTIFIGIIQ